MPGLSASRSYAPTKLTPTSKPRTRSGLQGSTSTRSISALGSAPRSWSDASTSAFGAATMSSGSAYGKRTGRRSPSTSARCHSIRRSRRPGASSPGRGPRSTPTASRPRTWEMRRGSRPSGRAVSRRPASPCAVRRDRCLGMLFLPDHADQPRPPGAGQVDRALLYGMSATLRFVA